MLAALARVAGAADALRLELEAPAAGAVVELAVPWAIARGWATAGPRVDQDLVLSLDLSDSTLSPSGVDVNQDGRVAGPRSAAWRWLGLGDGADDARDSVRAAEIAAARRLVDGLDFTRTRAAVLVFADNAWALSPLSSRPDEIRERLDEADADWREAGGATDLAKALRRAARLLGDASPTGDTLRRRDVVLLSDGEPTAPGNPAQARAEALAAAAELATAGIRVQAYALGRQSEAALAAYAQLAERTGGRFVQLETPGDVLRHLPQLDLAGVASVEVVNLTSGAPSRATHRGADGSFEAFVPLVAGENLIRVLARGRNGGETSLERTIVYAPGAARDPADAARRRTEGDALLRRLQLRSAQLELLQEIERTRGAVPQRELDVRPEGGAPGTPSP